MLSEKQWQPMMVFLLGVEVLLSLMGGVLGAAMVNQLAAPYLSANGLALLTLCITILGFQGAALVWVHFFLRAQHITWGEGFGFGRRNYGKCIRAALFTLPIVLACILVLGNASDWGLRALHERLHWNWLEPEMQPTVRLLQEKWPAHLIAAQGLFAIVIAPLAEEVLFRGILYTAIKQRGYPVAAVFGTAVLFAVIHFYPVGFLSLVFLATVLVAIYEWTENLLAPILLHSFFNAANFVLIVTHPKWADQLFKT